MDLDGGLICKIVTSKDEFDRAVQMGITGSLLAGPGKEAWKFISTYRARHDAMPGIDLLREKFGAPFRSVDADLGWIVDEVRKRDLFKVIQGGIEGATKKLEHRDPESALKTLEELVDEARTRRPADVKIKNLGDVGEEVIDLYLRTKRGEIGVPFPWPSMNDMTMGLWPGTLTFFAARPGVGKTFTVVMLGLYAWMKGYKVLIVSPEMSSVELAERAYAIHTKVSYRGVVSGTLGVFVESDFFKGVRALKDVDGFYIVDEAEDMTPARIEQAIDATNPDLIGIDSAYMIRTIQGNRYERMISTVDWLRELAKRKDKPVVALSQFNREKGNKGLDNFAMTDTIAWDAHNLIGLEQDEDMKADKRMLFKPLKVRRQAFQKEVTVTWDFDAMEFTEIGVENDFEDEEFEADVPF